MYQASSPTIAIIGGGFSGSMVAAHLLSRATCPLSVKLIERRPVVGQGVAFSTSLDCHLLNVPAGKMSAFADDPDHFLRWLQRQNEGIAPVKADTFVPRKLYGQYLRTVLADAKASALSKVRLEILTDEAIAIKTDEESVDVCLSSGEILAVDRVVLAPGNFPASKPPVADSSFYQSRRYIASPWSALPLLTSLPSEASVLVIGSGLTAVDLVVTLHQQGHKGTIHVVSRRGLLPQPHQATAAYSPCFRSDRAPKTIRALVRQVRQEIESASAQGYDWRAVIDSLRPETQALWQALPIAEQRRFLRHVRAYWEVHRHRVAPAIAKVLRELLDSKQLLLHAGRIQAYYEDADGVDAIVRRRCSSELNVVRADVVINCTGPECDYRKVQHPVILELLASGLIRPDPLNLGLDVAANGALIGAEGKASQWLYTLGSSQKGRLWETTAVPELRQQARMLAQEVVKSLGTDRGLRGSASPVKTPRERLTDGRSQSYIKILS